MGYAYRPVGGRRSAADVDLRGDTRGVNGVAAGDELEAQLAELERQRGEGHISELTFTVQKNLLLTLREQSDRRHAVALRIAPPPVPLPLPVQKERRGRPRPVRLHALPARLPSPREPQPTAPPPLPSAPAAATGGRLRRARPMLWLVPAAIVVVVLGAVVFTRLAIPGRTPGQPSGVATSSNPASKAQPGIGTSGPTVLTLDKSRPLRAGGTATLFIYSDHFTPVDVGSSPLPSGNFFAAAQVQLCAGSAAMTVSPSAFVLIEPDHSPVTTTAAPGEGMQPGLQVQALEPRQCASGWLTYAVATRPAALDDTADHLSWAIP